MCVYLGLVSYIFASGVVANGILGISCFFGAICNKVEGCLLNLLLLFLSINHCKVMYYPRAYKNVRL